MCKVIYYRCVFSRYTHTHSYILLPPPEKTCSRERGNNTAIKLLQFSQEKLPMEFSGFFERSKFIIANLSESINVKSVSFRDPPTNFCWQSIYERPLQVKKVYCISVKTNVKYHTLPSSKNSIVVVCKRDEKQSVMSSLLSRICKDWPKMLRGDLALLYRKMTVKKQKPGAFFSSESKHFFAVFFVTFQA